MRDISVILTKANQALQTLEKYKSVLEQGLTNISALEFEDLVTLTDVTQVLQRAQMVERIAGEIDKYGRNWVPRDASSICSWKS